MDEAALLLRAPAPVGAAFGFGVPSAGASAAARFAGAIGLSARERDVLTTLVAQEKLPQAAAHLGISLATLRTHIRNIRLKAGASSLTGVLLRAAMAPAPPVPAPLQPDAPAAGAVSGAAPAVGPMPAWHRGTVPRENHHA